jgi:hypothetical protein
MQAGDLVLLIGQYRGAVSPQVNSTGGQTWAQETTNTGSTNIRTTLAWATFNGTWTTNPDMSISSGTAAFTVRMVVFRPTDPTYTWSRNVALQNANVGAPVSPFTVSITGQTTTGIEPTVSVALWATADDNTWGTLSGTGWTLLGSQIRNTTGQDQSQALAYYIQSSGGATGNVSLRQATLGGDSTATTIISFAEVPPTPGNAGDIAVALLPLEARLTTPATVYQNPVRPTQPSWQGRRRKAGLALLLVPAFLSVGGNDVAGAQITALPAAVAELTGTTERLGDQASTLDALTLEVTGTVGEQSGRSILVRAQYPVPRGRRRHYGAIALRDPVPGVNAVSASLPAATAALDGTSEYLLEQATALPALSVAVDGSVVEFALQRNPGWRSDRYIHGRRHQYGAITLSHSRLAESACIIPLLPPVAALDASVVNPDVYAAGQGPKGLMVTREARQRAIWRRGQVGMAWMSAAPVFEQPITDLFCTMPEVVFAATGEVANNLDGEMSQSLPLPTAALTGSTNNFAGEVNSTLPMAVVASTGTFAPNYEADLNILLPDLLPALNVASPIVGDAVMTLPAATLDGGGTSTPDAIEGQVEVTLGAITTALDGTFTPITGTGEPTLPALLIEIDSTFVPYPIAGDIASTLPAIYMGEIATPEAAEGVGGRGRGRTKPRRADSLLALRTATLAPEPAPKKPRRKKKVVVEVTPEAPETTAKTPEAAVKGVTPPSYRVVAPAALDLSAIGKKRRIAKVEATKDLGSMDAAEMEVLMALIEKLLESDDG